MMKFCLYLLLCLILGFLDFHFELRGVLTIIFELIVCIYIIAGNKEEIKNNFKIRCNKSLLYGALLIVLILFFKESLMRFFLNTPVDDYKIDFYFIAALIIKSFTEELIFRGYWLKRFLEKQNVIFSILIVSIGFAFLHLFGRNNVIFALVSSILLSYVFYKTRSVLNTFVIHLTSNLFVVFLLPGILLSYSNIDGRFKIIWICSVFIIIVYILKLLRNNDRHEL